MVVGELTRTQLRKHHLRAYAQMVRKRGVCLSCGESDWRCLEFHHRDPTDKSFTIAAAVGRQVPLEKLTEELAKCDLLCANCHAKVTYKDVKTYTDQEYRDLSERLLNDVI
jgi:5-methylcytosine-specific restriction endonuclease McrA